MQQLSLAERFYAFVAAQSPERRIDHDSFRTCAVGEFYTSEGVDIHYGYRDRISALRRQLPEKVNEALAHHDKPPAPTYGDLQERIADVA